MTIETCQAFAMLSLFPAPHEKYLDSRSSMFIELAVRYARPPYSGDKAALTIIAASLRTFA